MKLNKQDKSERVVDRFWKKVKKKNPDQCWNWTSYISASGQGQFWIGKKVIPAHRYSFLLARGKIPTGKLVYRTCGNKRCVNPGHMATGKHKDLVGLMVEKGRISSGARHPRSVFQAKDVRKIRKLYSDKGWKIGDIARDFGVHSSTISKIISRKTWKDI